MAWNCCSPCRIRYDLLDPYGNRVFVKTTTAIATYAGRTMELCGDMQIAIKTLEAPVFPFPDDPPAGANMAITKLWKHFVEQLRKRMN